MKTQAISSLNQSVDPSQPSQPSPTLWTTNFIMLMTFLFGFPAGMLLCVINWRKMGLTRKALEHLIATLLGGVVLMIVLYLFPDQVSRGLGLGTTVSIMIYLYHQMTADINQFKATNGEIKSRSIFSGCLVSLSALLLFLVPSFILLYFLS